MFLLTVFELNCAKPPLGNTCENSVLHYKQSDYKPTIAIEFHQRFTWLMTFKIIQNERITFKTFFFHIQWGIYYLCNIHHVALFQYLNYLQGETSIHSAVTLQSNVKTTLHKTIFNYRHMIVLLPSSAWIILWTVFDLLLLFYFYFLPVAMVTSSLQVNN